MEARVNEKTQVEPSPPRRPLRAVALLLIGAVAGAAAVLLGYELPERSAGPAHGGGLHGEPTAGASVDGRIRIATFNIHGGRGRDDKLDLDRTAALLGELDIIGLQEVHGAGLPERSHEHQATELARKLDMPYLFAPTEKQLGRPSFGNALLCRLPVTSWLRIPLASSPDRGKRNALLATIDLNGRPLRLIVTHVDLRTDHVGQLGAVIALFRALQPPVILMGDLNAQITSKQMQELINQPDVDWVNADAQGKSRDWIIGRGLRFIEHESLDNGASDHRCLRAVVEVEPERKNEQDGISDVD
jgi:endonuclease/exonuclease/phosphatase family metal-dependent hydrolase